MIACLTSEQILRLHELQIERIRGQAGIINLGAVESAARSPAQAFAGVELYPAIEAKAACIAYTLFRSHPFNDGNKRTGHMAEVFLKLNGWELTGDVDNHESAILRLAAGQLSREELVEWIRARLRPASAGQVG